MERSKPYLTAKERRDRKKNRTNKGIGGPSTSTFVTDHNTWPDLLESVNRRTKNGCSSTSNNGSPTEKATIPSRPHSTVKEKINQQASHGIGGPSTSNSVNDRNTCLDLLESLPTNNQIEDQNSSLTGQSLLKFSGSTVGNPAKKKTKRFRIMTIGNVIQTSK